MNEKRFGVAMIGAGHMGKRHMTAIAQIPEFELRIVCDANTALAQEMAKQFGGEEYAEDYREVVGREDVDVVYVCVPANLHAAVTVQAARNGKHVFCEKPLALTLADGERMSLAAREAGVKLAVGFQHRFRQCFQYMRRLFLEKDMGRPIFYTTYSVAPVRPKSAMHDERGNGGPFVDVLCHYVDIWRFIFDSDPVRVFGCASTFAEGKEAVSLVKDLAPDTGVTIVEFASGDVGCFQISWGLPKGTPALSHEYILAPNALIEFEPFSRMKISRNGAEPQEVCDFRMSIQELQNVQSRYFASAIRDGRSPCTTGEDGLIALKVSLAAFESARTGQAVSI